ncbi:MAG: hypothetical protein AAGU74_12710 [Bacillota bacterium]
MALNGVTFDLRTVKAQDDGVVRKALAGKDGIIYGCGLSYSGLNVTIAPGWFLTAGRVVQIDENLTLPISASGNTYARLRFKVDLSIAASASTFTQGMFAWDVSPSGSFAALTQEDIYNGGDVYEIEFCVVQIASSIVAGITRQLEQIRSTNARMVYATLDDAGWSGTGPYTQAVSVPGIVPGWDIVHFDLVDEPSSAEVTAATAAGPVRGKVTSAGILTITAYGDKPTIDIPIKIMIAG